VAGCSRCWSLLKSGAAHDVLTLEERALPDLITAHVPEESIPVFRSLLTAPAAR